MTESELCRPTKPSKNTKLCARKSARSSLAPAGLQGARGAEPLASGNGKTTIRAIRLGEQSVDGKRSTHSTKASQKRLNTT